MRLSRVWGVSAGAGVAAVVAVMVAGCAAVESEPPAFAASPGLTGSWVQLPAAPLTARHNPEGVWVDGRFLVFGGWSSPMCPPNASCAYPEGSVLQDGAAFDPVAGAWSRIADLPMPLGDPDTVVAGGQVHVLGYGQDGDDREAGFFSYRPDQDRWTAHPLPPRPGRLIAAGDTVLVVPGSDETTSAIDSVFDAEQDTWQQLPEDPLGPSFDREGVWVDGRLLLAAKKLVPNPGADGPAVVRLARLDEQRTRWTTLPDSQIIGWQPMVVGSRVVWPGTGSADGGTIGNWGRSYPEGGIFDPASGRWESLPFPSGKVPWDGVTPVIGERVLVADQLLDPVSRAVTRVPKLPGRERSGAAVVGSPQTLLVWGGATVGNKPANLDTGFLLRPE